MHGYFPERTQRSRGFFFLLSDKFISDLLFPKLHG